MKRFLYIAEGNKLYTVDAPNAEMAYKNLCGWYNPTTKIIIIDLETKYTHIFSRELDKNGNLISIFDLLEE